MRLTQGGRALPGAAALLLVAAFPVASSRRLRQVPLDAHEPGNDKGGGGGVSPDTTSGAGRYSAQGTDINPMYDVHLNFDLETMDTTKGYSLVFDKRRRVMRMDPGEPTTASSALAWGRFADKIDSTGWSEIHITTSSDKQVSNDAAMYAAGYLEGTMTCVRMSQYFANTHKLLMRAEAQEHALMAVKKQVEQEIAFSKIKANLIPHVMTEEPADAYGKHMRYVLFQTWGVMDGYNFAANHYGVHTLSMTDIFMLNSGAEMPELMMAFAPQAILGRKEMQSFVQQGGQGLFGSRPMYDEEPTLLQRARRTRRRARSGQLRVNSTPSEDPLDDAHWEKRLAGSGRCSAFVRLSEGNADLYVGHTTWDDYSHMTRIFKFYDFPIPGADTIARKIAFPSYPGAVSSMDDFYVMDSGLTVTETSIELLDLFAWDKVTDFPSKPHNANFAHVMAVNRLAKTGAHWARMFTTANTGTYNSEWMVVDYNQFKPGKNISDNTLWVVETIPGQTHQEDLSGLLRRQGYWASFNRPYYDGIRKATGHDAAQRSHGALYSFEDAPRAQIFHKSAPSVQSLYDMRVLMTRNLYPYAGVEPNEPGHEISARMDLNPTAPIPNGGIDAKVVNYCLQKNMQVQGISGPSHANQRAFRWKKDDGSEMWPGWPHEGQPDTWNFGWVQMTPAGSSGLLDQTDC